MKRSLTIITLIGFTFTGCSNPINMLMPSRHTTAKIKKVPVKQVYQKPSPEKSDAYSETMRRVAGGIKDDPSYHRIALDTPEKKAWFQDLTYRLWDRQITRQEFLAKGLQRYPTHRYEFEFVIKGFAS